jgi:transposase
MLYTGIDYHESFSYLTIMKDDGTIISQKKLPNNEEIVGFLKEFGEKMEVAIEAGRSWYWIYDKLEDEGFEVKLSHPLKTKAIAYAKIKTDKVDSTMLAHLLRCNLLPLSYVSERSTRLSREILRYKASLVKLQSAIKNEIHILLAKNHVNHGYYNLFCKKGMVFLHSLSLAEPYNIALKGYVAIFEILQEKISLANKKIQQIAEKDCESLLLMSIPGMGYYSALVTKSEIGDVTRFRSAKQLCAYAGLVPSTHASGNTHLHGHITKQGSRWLRWILVEVALHVVRRPGVMRNFYLKVKKEKDERIAKVAAARKLLEWIYHILRDGKTYQEMERRARFARLR